MEVIRRIDVNYMSKEQVERSKRAKKSKLEIAKIERDKAKKQNNQAKELENQVSDELMRRGKTYEEQ